MELNGRQQQQPEQRVCGQCRHWHRVHTADLSQAIGECRHSPPSAQILGNGGKLTYYPSPGGNFSACSQFEERSLILVKAPEPGKE